MLNSNYCVSTAGGCEDEVIGKSVSFIWFI